MADFQFRFCNFIAISESLSSEKLLLRLIQEPKTCAASSDYKLARLKLDV
jgi:hypothetical protein